ncbi:NAD-dependent epimerase/dehydratase family protein [Haloactinomyces albus]|uniref:Nucleoside-diphosphate-sugar epimerase n=1 Tax=Haloactinomyces albus TaxID=1352928 RepID=A0AAE3ZBW4_9ACTN|nr:NAD-dependent epimerase/dehydratase family protein [Haloactinomyces albus]MDR7302061.1 nucleoside-diphosphate-sugar epimerase [Haloactinomyces albus]
MRLLVLGGTGFLSGAVAAEAVSRGHDVVCAARGRSGSVPDGARLVAVDRDEPGALDVLGGERFDDVVDVANVSLPGGVPRVSLPWIAEALRVLGANAGHWAFVSTINVYADTATPGQRPGSPLLEPREQETESTPETYGAVKVAGENAVRAAMGEKAFVVRPGLIVGPGDTQDRFGYWPVRFARGGRVVVPNAPNQPFQHIDVRDLAAWIVDAGEQRMAGTFDAVSLPTKLGPLLDEIAGLTAAEDTEIVRVRPETLAEVEINPWGGPKSMPLWLPETHHGLTAHDATASLEAGLRIRPLADTVTAVLEHERTLGLDRPREAGLTPDEEAEVLAFTSGNSAH